MPIISEAAEACSLSLDLTPSAPFPTENHYQSIELLMEVERRLGRTFRSRELDGIETISDLERLVANE